VFQYGFLEIFVVRVDLLSKVLRLSEIHVQHVTRGQKGKSEPLNWISCEFKPRFGSEQEPIQNTAKKHVGVVRKSTAIAFQRLLHLYCELRWKFLRILDHHALEMSGEKVVQS
jgi:hypothetical protein